MAKVRGKSFLLGDLEKLSTVYEPFKNPMPSFVGGMHNLWLNLSQDSFVVGTVRAQLLSRSRCLATASNGVG
jgi:hypothetical protein